MSDRKDKRKDYFRQRRQSWNIFLDDVHYNLRSSSFKKKLVAFAKFLLLIVFILLVPILLYVFGKNTLFNMDWYAKLPQLLADHPHTAFLALILLQIVQIVICILPGEPVQIASSYFYGIVGGYIIAIVGAVVGSIISFKIARFFGNDAIHIIFGKKRVADYQKKLNSVKALTLVFLIYLIPGIPKDLVSYVAGISEMRLMPFMIASTLGRSPGILGSLLIGAFWQSKNYLGLTIVGILIVVILYLCIKYRAKIMGFIDNIEGKHSREEHN